MLKRATRQYAAISPGYQVLIHVKDNPPHELRPSLEHNDLTTHGRNLDGHVCRRDKLCAPGASGNQYLVRIKRALRRIDARYHLLVHT